MSAPPGSPRWAPWLVLALALALRLPRIPARWGATAWLYAAYPWETVQALRAGQLPPFTGLHPPLWPLLHAWSEQWAPIPLLWLSASALCSAAAAALVARHGLAAGLLVATSPVALAYAAEVNDYPLAAALFALVLVLRPAAATGRWWPLALAGALAGWTHALAGLGAGLVALTLPWRWSVRTLATMGALALPLLPGALDAVGTGTVQPPFKAALVAGDLSDRFGLLWLLALPAALLGARRSPWLLLPGLGLPLALGLLVALGVAAPHQFPYLVLIGLPWALLAGQGGEGRLARLASALVGCTILLHGGVALLGQARALASLARQLQAPHALDLALAEAVTPWACDGPPSPACSGDAVYLLLPRRVDDDDKRTVQPALWRVRPWRRLPAVVPYAFDWGDHRHGQPRLHQGRVLYVEDHVRPQVTEAAAAHRRLWLVLDAPADSGEGRALADLLGRPGEAVAGQGTLWRLERAPQR
ncbi:hypothetical protein L6R53_21775 [Myxococcota bacterium]|nr:hypothetical protein [Myxococcota bacterium]